MISVQATTKKLSFRSVMTTLLNIYTSKHVLWHCFNFLQAFMLVYFSPEIGLILTKLFQPCVVEDLDENGNLIGLRVVQDPTSKHSESCPILPSGYKMPKSVFLAWLFVSTGPITVFNSNLVWFLIYKLEHPFFE